MDKNLRNKLLPFTLSIGAILADQLSKLYIVKAYPAIGSFIKDVFGNDLLWILHVRNKAIAFSLGHTLPDTLRLVFFIVAPLLVLTGLTVYYFKSDEFSRYQRWLVTGIIGGGIGNIIDRIFRPDGVVDFISVKFFGLFGLDRWPTFNIADSCVLVCGILLFISIIFARQPAALKKGSPNEQEN